jgi:hypothetical protein
MLLPHSEWQPNKPLSFCAGSAIVLNGSSSCCCWDSSSSTASSADRNPPSAPALHGQHPDMDPTRKSALFGTDLPPIAPGTVLGKEVVSLWKSELVCRIVFGNNGYQEGNYSHAWCYMQTPGIAWKKTRTEQNIEGNNVLFVAIRMLMGFCHLVYDI